MIKGNLNTLSSRALRLCLVSIPFLLIAWAVGYFLWTISASMDAEQSRLYPLLAFKQILRQLSLADSLSTWNIPWVSIANALLWFAGQLALGQCLFYVRPTSSPLTASSRLLIYFALGFTAFGLLQFAVGLAGFARFPLIALLPLPILASLIRKPLRSDTRQVLSAACWQWKSLRRCQQITFLAIAFLLLCSQLPALAPPIQSDGIRYHLGAPQEYLKNGHIGYLPLNAYSNMPFLVEMHFLSALASHSPQAAPLMHFTLALFTALAIYVLSRELTPFPRPTSPFPFLLAAALYLGIPCAAILASWAFTDHAISFFLVLSAWATIQYAKHPSPRWIVITGIFLGALMGTKYTMMPIAALLVIGTFIFPRRPLTTRIRQTLLLAFIALAIGGIWLIKNLILTGNPFYPLASSIFPSPDWTTESNQFLHARAADKGIGAHGLALITVLYHATFHWISANFEQQNIGPLALPIALLAFLGTLAKPVSPASRASHFAILAITIFSFLLWFGSYQSNRLLLPTVALALTLLPPFIIQIPPRLRPIAIAPLFAMAIYGLAWAVQWSLVLSPYPSTLRYLTGQITEKQFRYNSLTYARAYDTLNSRVSHNDRVLLIGEHRIFGAQFSAIWSDWFDTPALAHILRTHHLTTLDDLLAWLRRENIRWIMINQRELEPQMEMFKSRFSPAEWAIFQQLLQLTPTDQIKITTVPPGATLIELADPA